MLWLLFILHWPGMNSFQTVALESPTPVHQHYHHELRIEELLESGQELYTMPDFDNLESESDTESEVDLGHEVITDADCDREGGDEQESFVKRRHS